MKARLRILLTLAYVLALAGHGLEHRFASADPESQTAERDACDSCAFLTYAGHALGTQPTAPVPADLPLSVIHGPATATADSVLVLLSSGPLGARAPPAWG